MDGIVIKNLSKKYKDVLAVNDLSLEIKRGELFGLLGVNGAGKTTTVKMLCGLTAPTSGTATVLGIGITDPRVKNKLAVSPQETAVAPSLSVWENLLFICGAYGLNGADSVKKSTEIAEKLGLGEVKNRRAGKLSGGYKRRLSIAMALVSDPEVLFLDEPTLGLDVIARSELWDIIAALKGEITVILTTHYLEEAESLCDRVAIMRGGRLMAVGTTAEICEKADEQDFEKAFIKIVKEGV